MSLLHAALMFIAAFLAGVVNSIAGGGTLLTFPVLIWLGLDPKIANATTTPDVCRPTMVIMFVLHMITSTRR